MGLINAIVDFLQKLFQWWFIVMPWEQAIHVRAGKNVKLKGAGLYLRIPFCRRDNRSLRILEIWNKGFARHLVEKRGFTYQGGDNLAKRFAGIIL